MEATIIETKYNAPGYQRPYREVTYYGWDRDKEIRLTVTESCDTWATMPDISSKVEMSLTIMGEVLVVH